MADLYSEIKVMAKKYSDALEIKIKERVAEMEDDDQSHCLIYRVLGISDEEGKAIDVYQNKGRFLYKYAGSFLEEAAQLCLTKKYPKGGPKKIPNTLGKRPKTFQIDFVIDDSKEKEAIELKWRDATTDGDHITKEHTRLQTVADAGYKPIRVMFYYPNREQAIKIQKTIETLYKGASGEYYFGDSAWDYIRDFTGTDLKAILEKIADENTKGKCK